MNSADFLEALVRIPSVSGSEQEASAWLVSQMQSLGYDEAFVDEAGNAVGILGEGDEDILFVGHIDTVPGEIPVRFEKGELWGRGSVDAKGPLAAFVLAIAKTGRLKRKRCVVVGAVEEEIHTSKGARHLIGKYRPSCIIIGEPSGLCKITLGYKGSLRLRYSLKLSCSHSASGQANANEVAVEFWNDIKKMCFEYSLAKELFDTLQASLIHFDSSSDALFDCVCMELRFRIPPAYDIDALKRYCVSLKGHGVLEFYGEEVPHLSGKSNPLVRSFLVAMRERGLSPRFAKKTGTSDMNVLAPHYSVPIVAYGAGNSLLDHTPEERLSIREFEESIEVLSTLLRQLSLS